jgi:protein-S-isoprenylcysteine O-methyltransferase Ste14
LSALLGTILFVLVVPGTVIVLVPYWLTGWRPAPPLLGAALTRWLGVVLILGALPLFTSFLGRFVWEGHGTPAPVAPTKHLVVGGPFRWTRNPGYIAVVTLIGGQALVLGSGAVLVYAILVALAFHTFVVVYEEPTLRDQFGAEFEEYRRRVPRWIPRRPVSGRRYDRPPDRQ